MEKIIRCRRMNAFFFWDCLFKKYTSPEKRSLFCSSRTNQREKQYHSRAMQQEELQKRKLYDIRESLKRVDDAFGLDKLFGMYPRQFSMTDFTKRTADSAYRLMCPKLHQDKDDKNGYTTNEKDIARACFAKLQEAKDEYNRQNENIDARRAYLTKEYQKHMRAKKQLEKEGVLDGPPENSNHWCCGGKDLKLAKGAEVYYTVVDVEERAHLKLVRVIEFSEDGTLALVEEPHGPSALKEDDFVLDVIYLEHTWVQTSSLRREYSLYELVRWHYTTHLGKEASKDFKLKFISSANRTIISENFARFAKLYENVNFKNEDGTTHTETKLKKDLIQDWEIMNFKKMSDENSRNWIEGETTWEPTFKLALTIRGVSIECFVVVCTGFEMDADILLGQWDWSVFQSRAGDLCYKPYPIGNYRWVHSADGEEREKRKRKE